MPDEFQYDVFLRHNSKGKSRVCKLAALAGTKSRATCTTLAENIKQKFRTICATLRETEEDFFSLKC